MKNTFVTLTIISMLSSNLLAQNQSDVFETEMKNEIKKIKYENQKLKNDIKNLNSTLISTQKKLDSLKNQTEQNTTSIINSEEKLKNKLSENESKINEQFFIVNSYINKNFLFTLFIIIFAVIFLYLIYYFFYFKKHKNSLNYINQQINTLNNDYHQILQKINETKTNIEETLIKEFIKQTEILDLQLKKLEEQNKTANTEPDHSLALKLANEINILERNLNQMDPNVKGYKQLKRSIERLKEHLNANGYEILDLLNKNYHHGLPVVVINSYPDESLDKDVEIISKILIPAVRYNDKIIQVAQVEVNVGV